MLAPLHKNPVTLMYLAGAALLLVGTTHGAGHMLAISDPDAFPIGRRALYEAMRAYELGDLFGASRWTSFKLFSLSHALLLAFAGLATIQVANMGGPALRHRFAGLSALFWAGAGAVWMWQAPFVGVPLLTLPAAGLYGLAWYRSR